MSLKKGYIQIYTGNGKGKTTAAFGQALRAAGSGLKTFIVQFMKNSPYGAIQIFEQIPNWVTFEHYGNDSFVFSNIAAGEKDIYMAQQAFHRARKAMSSGKFDIVIMDEVCVAIFFELLKTQDLLSLLEEKPGSVELILTGRYCPLELIERADLVTEMQEIKHYYQKGVVARKGIES
jgi:cob(I)alamin adenosyltransferase